MRGIHERRKVGRDEVLDELVSIGDQLERATESLRGLVEELRSELPEVPKGETG